jgi:putative tryptophan/tyrosine transport system substrate-binding protein
MRRREFIILVGGATAAWPIATHAQQQPLPVIGFLDSGSPAGMEHNLASFRGGLKEIGYNEGQNVAIEFRWAQGKYDQLPALAAELVGRRVAVIAATRSPAPALAAKSASATVPIVFQIGSDPVEAGLVASLNRPGGNITGATRLSTELSSKRLGLLTDLFPTARVIALVVNPSNLQAERQVKEMQEAAHSRGLRLNILNASNADELDGTIKAVAQNGIHAIIISIDPFFFDRREQIVALAARHAIPAIYGYREFVVAGGLLSYDASVSDSFRQVGVYVGQILKGAKPADLPVEQPVKFELVINLKAAKALGLTIPPTLLATADEVIE